MAEPLLFSSLSVVNKDKYNLAVNVNDEVGDGGRMIRLHKRAGGKYNQQPSNKASSDSNDGLPISSADSNEIMIDNDSRYSLEDSRKNFSLTGFSIGAPSNDDMVESSKNESILSENKWTDDSGEDNRFGLSGFDSSKQTGLYKLD